DVVKSHGGKIPDGKIVIKDVIADNMFQQLLLRPEEYDVLATTNLNGDYLSDAAAAQIGGLGVAAGGNIGDTDALVEAGHCRSPAAPATPAGRTSRRPSAGRWTARSCHTNIAPSGSGCPMPAGARRSMNRRSSRTAVRSCSSSSRLAQHGAPPFDASPDSCGS